MSLARSWTALALAGVLAGCAHGPQPLYAWGSFPHQQYDTLRGAGASPAEQIRTLEAEARKADDAKAALPPGLRAHLGLLYLDSGDADKARSLWLAEKAAFPESAPYIDTLLKRLGAPAAPASAPSADAGKPKA